MSAKDTDCMMMNNVLTLISDPVAVALTLEDTLAAEMAIKEAGGEVGTAVWLAPGIACDLPFNAPLNIADGVRKALSGRPLDVVTQPATERRKKLMVADMESTIIENEMLDELAELRGIGKAITDITARAMAGELNFEDAIKARVNMLKGLSESALEDALATIRITPGAATLVATMRSNGAYCALVSGGFEFFTSWVRQRLGFDYDQANHLEIKHGALTGSVREPVLGRNAKHETLLHLSAEHGIDPTKAITVGDGANDLAMLEAAGMGVGFRAKPIVAKQVRVRVDYGDLTALLYIQGYRGTEFIHSV